MLRVIMYVSLLAVAAIAVLLAACCKVSGDLSREEEERYRDDLSR